jgi:serine/threonine protein kinase
VESELEAIKQLGEFGAHANLIEILRHGHLGTSDWHFIDMELCDITLKDYIDGKRLEIPENAKTDPCFVPFDCSPDLKALNVWTILKHIVSGLEFIHKHNYVHRDLKPQNGRTTHCV